MSVTLEHHDKQLQLVDTVLSLDAVTRRTVLAQLSLDERLKLDQLLQERIENPWFQYRGDPIGFISKGMGEAVWSGQQQILESVLHNKRTVVRACHAPGKTHIASRVVLYFALVYPTGMTRVTTTASSFRQVRNILWPYIRRAHAKHNMPGEMHLTEWQMGAERDIVADGFSAANSDETAVQGLHYPFLLIVVDEAAGISHTLGRAFTSILTDAGARILVLGNPPTEEEGTWFEQISESPEWNSIRISAFDTPNFTGEATGRCTTCPSTMPAHDVAYHLIGPDWVNEVAREFGTDSAYYQARVMADFPKNTIQKALPMMWLEAAIENYKNAKDAGTLTPGRIKLGVDIASDGGDEFVIAKLDGWRASITHTSAGEDNADPVQVAGTVLTHILDAEKLHKQREIVEPVRVKLDAIGLGWGVVGLLQAWKREGKHTAEIIGVNVSERAQNSERFDKQRSEMWWATRTLIAPDSDGDSLLQLDINQRALKQLNAPTYGTDSTGRITIEKKADMKKRLGVSPDRAEAILLALYEPPQAAPVAAAAPILIGQANPWKMG